MSDPSFVIAVGGLITALATLTTAITALVKVFHVDRTTKANQATLQEVSTNTNGLLHGKQQQVDDLRAQVKKLEDTGYGGGHLDPHAGQPAVS